MLTLDSATHSIYLSNGAIAQLGERNTGSVEVGGSIPPSSTNKLQTTGYNVASRLPNVVLTPNNALSLYGVTVQADSVNCS